jgi:hypothetical protein
MVVVHRGDRTKPDQPKRPSGRNPPRKQIVVMRSSAPVRHEIVSPAACLARRPLLTPADVLFCALPVALFLSIVSLV